MWGGELGEGGREEERKGRRNDVRKQGNGEGEKQVREVK